jgi:hypothetical protein
MAVVLNNILKEQQNVTNLLAITDILKLIWIIVGVFGFSVAANSPLLARQKPESNKGVGLGFHPLAITTASYFRHCIAKLPFHSDHWRENRDFPHHSDTEVANSRKWRGTQGLNPQSWLKLPGLWLEISKIWVHKGSMCRDRRVLKETKEKNITAISSDQIDDNWLFESLDFFASLFTCFFISRSVF